MIIRPAIFITPAGIFIAPAPAMAARELRDRYLDEVNDGSIQPAGKYEVSRAIEETPTNMPLLAA